MKYLFLALVWITWCAIHSIMMSSTVNNYLKSRMGINDRFYRIFYNIVAIITLIIAIIYSMSVQSQPIFFWNGYLKIILILIISVAIYLFVSGAISYDMRQFIGLKPMCNINAHTTSTESETLKVAGIHGLIRHPWYLAVILVIWARRLNDTTIIVNIILTIYIIIGTFLDERKLVLKYGDEYRNYKKKVSMFIPYKWLKHKIWWNTQD